MNEKSYEQPNGHEGEQKTREGWIKIRMNNLGAEQRNSGLYTLNEIEKYLVWGVESVTGVEMVNPSTSRYGPLGYLSFRLNRFFSGNLKKNSRWAAVDNLSSGQRTRQYTEDMTRVLLEEFLREYEIDVPDAQRADGARNLWQSGLTPEVLGQVFHYMYPDAEPLMVEGGGHD